MAARTARPWWKGDAVVMDVGAIGQDSVLRGHGIDVTAERERTRQRRLWRLFAWMLAARRVAATSASSPATRSSFGLPHFDAGDIADADPARCGRAHRCRAARAARSAPAGRRTCAYQASEIDVTLDDVVGLGPVKDEVVKTLNLFLGYQTFRDQMGGNPRKAILFEGPPGTGKTYMAKAMAKEAGVPYLFVSSTAFQSMYYGQTGRKIRNYFKALRKAAREEGGAIGFIEEIDAIAGARSGMREHSPLPVGARRRGVVDGRAERRQRGHLRRRQRAAHPAAVVRPADVRTAVPRRVRRHRRTVGCRSARQIRSRCRRRRTSC